MLPLPSPFCPPTPPPPGEDGDGSPKVSFAPRAFKAFQTLASPTQPKSRPKGPAALAAQATSMSMSAATCVYPVGSYEYSVMTMDPTAPVIPRHRFGPSASFGPPTMSVSASTSVYPVGSYKNNVMTMSSTAPVNPRYGIGPSASFGPPIALGQQRMKHTAAPRYLQESKHLPGDLQETFMRNVGLMAYETKLPVTKPLSSFSQGTTVAPDISSKVNIRGRQEDRDRAAAAAMIENSHGPQAAAAVEAYLYEVTDGNARQGLMGTAHGHQGGHHGVKKGYSAPAQANHGPLRTPGIQGKHHAVGNDYHQQAVAMIEKSYGPQVAAIVEAYLHNATDGNAGQGMSGTTRGQGQHTAVSNGYPVQGHPFKAFEPKRVESSWMQKVDLQYQTYIRINPDSGVTLDQFRRAMSNGGSSAPKSAFRIANLMEVQKGGKKNIGEKEKALVEIGHRRAHSTVFSHQGRVTGSHEAEKRLRGLLELSDRFRKVQISDPPSQLPLGGLSTSGMTDVHLVMHARPAQQLGYEVRQFPGSGVGPVQAFGYGVGPFPGVAVGSAQPLGYVVGPFPDIAVGPGPPLGYGGGPMPGFAVKPFQPTGPKLDCPATPFNPAAKPFKPGPASGVFSYNMPVEYPRERVRDRGIGHWRNNHGARPMRYKIKTAVQMELHRFGIDVPYPSSKLRRTLAREEVFGPPNQDGMTIPRQQALAEWRTELRGEKEAQSHFNE